MNNLLELLRQNGRETPENLAKLLQLSVEEVLEQMRELEESGVIRAYQAVVNEEKLDQARVTTVIEVKVIPEDEGGFDSIAQRISRFPEVESLFLMSVPLICLYLSEARRCMRPLNLSVRSLRRCRVLPQRRRISDDKNIQTQWH